MPGQITSFDVTDTLCLNKPETKTEVHQHPPPPPPLRPIIVPPWLYQLACTSEG